MIDQIAIGLDPSVSSYGISNGFDHERIVTKPTSSLRDRAAQIMIRVAQFITEQPVKPLLVTEGPISYAADPAALFDAGYLKCALDDVAHRYGCEVIVIQPATLKKHLTGRGNAPKTEVALEILHRYGIRFTDDPGADKAHAFALHRYGMDVIEGKIAHADPVARGSKKKPLKKITFELLDAAQVEAIAAGTVQLPIEIPKRALLMEIPKAWVARAKRLQKIAS